MFGLDKFLPGRKPQPWDFPFALSPEENLHGEQVLAYLAKLSPEEQHQQKQKWQQERTVLVVVTGDKVIAKSMESYPVWVQRLCAEAKFYRYNGVVEGIGGGYFPGRDEIWLNAGVETWESRNQIYASGRHELFHYVNWHDDLYHWDMDMGWPYLIGAIAESKRDLPRYPDYVAFLRRFLAQGDHANPVEFFADVPTNIFNEIHLLPLPLNRYFGSLIRKNGRPPLAMGLHFAYKGLPKKKKQEWILSPGMPLDHFHRLLDPDQDPDY